MVELVENYWTGYIILENHFQVNNASQIGLSYEQKLRDGKSSPEDANKRLHICKYSC